MKARALACAFVLGCGESSSEPATAVDIVNDSSVIDALQEVAEPDASPDVTDDVPDTGPGFVPLANVFAENPIDSPDVTEVQLLHFPPEGAPGGVLSGDFARVRNCTQDLDGKEPITLSFGAFSFDVTYCTPEHTAVPGADGSYRHIAPPAEASIDADPFAEVMMYHHVQRIHDYFQRGFGLTDLDYPFEGLVNIQVYVALCEAWSSFGNALYTPTGTFTYPIEFDFGLGGPAIIFGQTATKDFAYEADVISHEYTHAMIGATRLNTIVLDEQGLDNHAGALNEAYADYFACTLANESLIGNYALDSVEGLTLCGVPLFTSGNLARDLTAQRRCPDDLTAEVHADAEIFSSALWAIRDLLGPELADKLILDALVGFSGATDFNIAAQATLGEAGSLTQAQVLAVKAIFESRGLLDCQRVVPAAKVGARLPVAFEGGGGLGETPLGQDTPGYLQVGVDVPAGATDVTLELTLSGDATIDALLKPGTDAVYFGPDLKGAVAFTDAVARVPFEAAGNGRYRVRLAGSCLSAGPWAVAILSRGGGFSLVKASVSVTEAPGAATVPCP